MGQKFVLEFINSSTGCISSESVLEISDIALLSKVIDPEELNIHPAAQYELQRSDIDELKLRFGIVNDDPSPQARLRPWRAMDGLPYVVHTNRELALMLEGKKPFAAFSEYYPSALDFEFIPERFFEPYVRNGTFSKREYIDSGGGNCDIRFVLYSEKGQEWRFEAYILLKKTAEKAGWSEGFERMEGSLLGYEDWENDVYIERIFNASVR